jgi:aspartate kinase
MPGRRLEGIFFADPLFYLIFIPKINQMKVFKFGGASVKDGSGISNMVDIVARESDNLVLVISAFGKTTNALEKVLKAWISGDDPWEEQVDRIYDYHKSVIDDLLTDKTEITGQVGNSFATLKEYLAAEKKGGYDFEYDQIVSYGEIWSTMIVAAYLSTVIPGCAWIDIRGNLLTDDRYRDANILWSESRLRLQKIFDFTHNRIYITQGFIGGTVSGKTTTLGREGSDYTAAIIANLLDAEKVVFWKDVPGILNADPKWLPDARRLEEISYKEAVEMTFSGAKVIHPKTIKPLHNKNIPLHVRSFVNPDDAGTIIKTDAAIREIMPVFIRKEVQILLSILPKDFSFVMGDNLSRIFHSFNLHGIKVNLVEASAVSIDVCIDDERPKVDSLINDLTGEFSVVYNENVEMLSIRHYTVDAITRIIMDREILLEQRTRSTVRFVVRSVASLRSQ